MITLNEALPVTVSLGSAVVCIGAVFMAGRKYQQIETAENQMSRIEELIKSLATKEQLGKLEERVDRLVNHALEEMKPK